MTHDLCDARPITRNALTEVTQQYGDIWVQQTPTLKTVYVPLAGPGQDAGPSAAGNGDFSLHIAICSSQEVQGERLSRSRNAGANAHTGTVLEPLERP